MRGNAGSFAAGFVIGMLGGLIGLGGAEFRLPLLIGVFAFGPLEAVILNKAMSLLVVAAALPFRAASVPIPDVLAQWPVLLNLLAGSLVGAYIGAGWAIRLHSQTFYRVIACLLVAIAAVLYLGHGLATSEPLLAGPALALAGLAAGLVIGVVASLMGVAGGELLIPTIVLLYGIDIRLAGSMALAVSLPTMLVGFARFSRDRSFAVLRDNLRFVTMMAAGSLLGAFAGGQLLGIVPEVILIPGLVVILLLSAVKVWRH